MCGAVTVRWWCDGALYGAVRFPIYLRYACSSVYVYVYCVSWIVYCVLYKHPSNQAQSQGARARIQVFRCGLAAQTPIGFLPVPKVAFPVRQDDRFDERFYPQRVQIAENFVLFWDLSPLSRYWTRRKTVQGARTTATRP